MTFDGHRGGDYGTHVFATTNYGGSWRSLGSNLPKGEVVRTISEDVKNADVLYVGTETGLWVTTDRGKAWIRVKANLPTVPIYEIALHPRDNDMLLATHGRAVWVLDDLTPFQQWAKSETAVAVAFEPAPAVALNSANDQMRGFEGDRIFLGLNPAPGAALAYRLKAEAKDVKWTIRDASGVVQREIEGDEVKDRNQAGLNIVQWDLRVQPLRPLRGQQSTPAGGGGGGFGGGGLNGPFVLPGAYRGTLTVDGKDATTVQVVVSGDPAITLAETDRKTWFETAMKLHRMQGQANEAADAVNAAGNQFGAIQQQTRDQNVPPNLKTQMDLTGKELEGLRRRLGLSGSGGGAFGGGGENVRGRLGQVKGAVMGSTSLPTEVQVRQVKELEGALPKLLADVTAGTEKLSTLARELVTSNVLFAPVKPGT